MRKRFLPCVVLAGCALPPTEPTFSSTPFDWFEGERQHLTVDWPAPEQCNNEGFSCTHGSTPNVELNALTCDGCRAVTRPSDARHSGGLAIDVEAMTTDPITVTVVVEADGRHRKLVATGIGDRELALHALCKLAFTSVLDGGSFSSEDFHDCRATRSSSETAIVVLAMTTFHGHERFAFCPDGAYCSPNYPRKTSMIAVVPAPDRWVFGEYPAFSGPDGGTVIVSAPLATGEISVATVVIPPIASL